MGGRRPDAAADQAGRRRAPAFQQGRQQAGEVDRLHPHSDLRMGRERDGATRTAPGVSLRSAEAAMSERETRSPDAPLGEAPAERGDNLLDWLYRLRDRQRKVQRN